MTARGIVAADTNILRQPTTRRYLTSLEELRGRPVAVLPTVNFETVRQLQRLAKRYVQQRCERHGINDRGSISLAVDAAREAAVEWWQEERFRNDSAYVHVADLGELHYTGMSNLLPADAFADDNEGDSMIYAQAWAHDLDILATRNRRSIDRDRIKDWFRRQGQTAPPVDVRGLYEHTRIIADGEDRAVDDVAFEAMLGAVIAGNWSPENAIRTRRSCQTFIRNLELSEGRARAAAFGENELARSLERKLNSVEDIEGLVRLCEHVRERLPMFARESEARYHGKAAGRGAKGRDRGLAVKFRLATEPRCRR